MIEISDKSKCCGCEACKNICPKKCIEMIEDEEGFIYPKVNKEKCINCGLCEKVCQYLKEVDNIAYENEEDISVFACTLKNYSENNSSTAGMFYNLGKYVIDNGGFVCGVIYDDDMNVKHIVSNKLSDLYKMRGSKYVQSRIGDVYSTIRELLNSGKTVLFSGTPCQVGGLYKFLRKPYDNLIAIDIICYGVPSPKVYRDYIKYLKKKNNNSKIEFINFRNKNNGWLKPSTKIEYETAKYNTCVPSNNDPYYATFISHICMRDACTNCLYTTTRRKSDITLGDFWGIDKMDVDVDISNGVEKVLINTDKGRNLFNSIKNEYNVYEMKMKDAIRPNLQRPPKRSSKKDEFFSYYNKNGFIKSYKKYVKVKFSKRVINKLKKIFKRRHN